MSPHITPPLIRRWLVSRQPQLQPPLPPHKAVTLNYTKRLCWLFLLRLIILENSYLPLSTVFSWLFPNQRKIYSTTTTKNMDQSNSTLSTCQGAAGSLPNLPFAMSCGTSKYDNGNGTIGESVLTSCCAGNPVAEFGNAMGVSNCWVSSWPCFSESFSLGAIGYKTRLTNGIGLLQCHI